MAVIAASSYSFHRLVKTGDAKRVDAPGLAREAGAEAIEFAVGGSLSPPLDRRMALDLLHASQDEGLPITGVCIAAELLRGSRASREAALTSVFEQLDSAASMGVTRFRHDATLGPENGDLSDESFNAALPSLVAACSAIAEHAAQLGIASSVENHGRFVQHALRVARLVQAVNHRAFGVTLDIGNSLFAPQDPVEAAARLAPFAITVHVKDFEIDPAVSPDAGSDGIWPTWPGGPMVRGCIVGAGDLDVAGCIGAALRSGFDGPFVVEFEGPVGDPRTAVARGIGSLRAMLSARHALPRAVDTDPAGTAH